MIIINYDYTLNGVYTFDYTLTFYPNINKRFLCNGRSAKIEVSPIPYPLQPFKRIFKV